MSSKSGSSLSCAASDLSELFSTATGGSNCSRSKRKVREKHSKDKSLSSAVRVIASNKENVDRTLLSLITRGRISQKVGLYSKGKASDTILRRKPLASINKSNSVDTDHSLKVPYLSPTLREPTRQKSSPVSMDDDDEGEVPEESMRDVSWRILEGLKSDKGFSEREDYCMNIKLGLRKLMKQSNPSTFNEIESCLLKPIGNPQLRPSTPPPPLSPSKLTPLDDHNSVSSHFLSSSICNQLINVDPLCPMFVESTVNVPMYAEPSISLSVLGEPQEMEQQQSYHLVHGGLSQELTMRDPDFLDFLDQHCSLQIEGSIERPRMYPHRLH